MAPDGLIKELLKALVSGTVFAAVLGLFGRLWLDRRLERLKYELGVDTKTRELMLRSRIEFKERQLAEFYGPIYAYLKRGRPIYDLWTEGRLDEVDEHIQVLFVATNNEIVRIILSKSHLIQGSQIPASFTQFLTHVAVWQSYLTTPHKGIPFQEEEFPEVYYPETFEEEIFKTTETLKAELDELHRKYGLQAGLS